MIDGRRGTVSRRSGRRRRCRDGRRGNGGTWRRHSLRWLGGRRRAGLGRRRARNRRGRPRSCPRRRRPRGRQSRRANRRRLRPCRRRSRRLIRGASDRALEVEVLKLARADRVGGGRVGGRLRGRRRRRRLGERRGGREPHRSRQQNSNTAQNRPHSLRLLNDSPHHTPAAKPGQCPPHANTSSTWRMNGAGTPIRRLASIGRRPTPARCRRRRGSRPAFRR